ncbi:MAG: uracil-DNA glycosylase family protein [Rhodovibrio sp.]|nr:uracil-DNA glycosylase family protein [Rhodovibrio sp.]
MAEPLDRVLAEARACRHCEPELPLGANPVLRAAGSARLLIVGQAPGTKVHNTGVPWNDASGDRLRQWLEVDRDTFYDPGRIAIVPMGFCYPGRGARGGDMPPRPECAPIWHPRLLAALPNVELTLLVGSYAQEILFGPGATAHAAGDGGELPGLPAGLPAAAASQLARTPPG